MKAALLGTALIFLCCLAAYSQSLSPAAPPGVKTGDDYVGILFDTFNDQRRAYEFDFNPLGVQADGIWTEGQGEDFSLDLVMESKGMITTDGYTIEVAIPFKSLDRVAVTSVTSSRWWAARVKGSFCWVGHPIRERRSTPVTTMI